MGSTDSTLLGDVPDLGDVPAATAWLEAKLALLRALGPSPEIEASFRPVSVLDLIGAPAPPFGLYGDAVWRRLVLATLLADWSCYPLPVDQVGIERLFQVMFTFPAGFRVWWAEAPGSGWLPVGYTGWFPIAELTFEALAARPAELRYRNMPALPTLDPGGSFIYLFNYSVLGPLRGTSCSRRLLRALADDIAAVPLRGLAAITVSEEGSRVAERFGMRRSGTLVVDGTPEQVYTRRVT
ncbi:hypothetical protein WME91_49545 [Sorangium sp. So ce269]